MALPSNGPVSASQIRTEINVPTQVPFTLNAVESLNYSDLNALSISESLNRLTLEAPFSMSEWYGYNHSLNRPCSNTAHQSLKAPFGYEYATFCQVDVGTSDGEVSFSGSNFATSGNATESFVSYSAYYSTYSLNIPGSKLLNTGVLTSTSPNKSFYYIYNATSGSIVTWVFQGTEIPSITFDAQYIVITYTFNTGTDLDTRTRIAAPDVGQNLTGDYLGYAKKTFWPNGTVLPPDGSPLTGSDRPYLIWGGDNTGTGVESILFDVSRFKQLNASATSSVIDLRSFWFGTVGITPVVLDATFYTGSYMIRNGVSVDPKYKFVYAGSQPSASLASNFKTISAYRTSGGVVTGSSDLEDPAVSAALTRGERTGVFTYQFGTFVASINTNDTTTPYV